MTETCPVCGDVVEHVRLETAGESEEANGATASFDIDDLCTVDADTRWDRICTVAAAADEGNAPVLELYYHFFEEE